jgi:hypothetical protein
VRIRFLRTTPSANPDVPFQAGQIIEVRTLTDELKAFLDGGDPCAVVLSDPPLEAATVGAPEHAVRPRAKGRTA